VEGTSGAKGRAERLERCSETRLRLNLRNASGRSLVVNAAMSSTTSTGGWSASSSRMRTTRSILAPSGIVSPAFQLGTVLASVGGSAGTPSDVSSLKRKPCRHPVLLSAWGRTARWILPGPARGMSE
jgi:hypothetical protein